MSHILKKQNSILKISWNKQNDGDLLLWLQKPNWIALCRRSKNELQTPLFTPFLTTVKLGTSFDLSQLDASLPRQFEKGGNVFCDSIPERGTQRSCWDRPYLLLRLRFSIRVQSEEERRSTFIVVGEQRGTKRFGNYCLLPFARLHFWSRWIKLLEDVGCS